MISLDACNLLSLWNPGGGWRVECRADEAPSILATLAAIAIAATFVFWVFRKLVFDVRATGKLRPGAWIPTALSLPVAGLLVSMAAGAPVLVHNDNPHSSHVIVAVDTSESTLRRTEDRQRALARVEVYLDRLSRTTERQVTVSLIAFADGARTIANRIPAEQALSLLGSDAVLSILPAGATRVGEALREAAGVAAQEPDSDIVVLLSDGNDTETDLKTLAETPGMDTTAIFPVAINAGMPAEGIVSAYLPAAIRTETQPRLRVVLDPGENGGEQAQPWGIQLARNGEAIETDQPQGTRKNAIHQIRLPVRFDGRGVQYVEIGYTSDTRNYQQRVLTLVKSPIQVLAYGETGFLNTLSKDRFEVTQSSPGTEVDFSKYDVVVLGELDAKQFSPVNLERMASNIGSSGLGLLLVNGPMRGGTEQPTVVQSYKDTPLDALLPVSADPRFLIDEPPPRDVIVMVDTSGSMGSHGVGAARQAITNIIGYMRPVDRIQIITFDLHSPGWTHMDAAGKARINQFLSTLSVGGRSDASSAFVQAAHQARNYTAVFLITDGEITEYDYAKDGMSFVYLEYGSAASPTNRQIAGTALQSEMLNPNRGIRYELKFFKPEERTEYFLPEPVQPLLVKPLDGIAEGIETPGVALSYARIDADRILVRNKGTGEPVLAFRDAGAAGGGRTGAFLSRFGPAWTGTEAGRSAIEAAIAHLARWSKRDRYDIRLEDLGKSLTVKVTILEDDNGAPLPETLGGTLSSHDIVQNLTLTPDPGQKGVFLGRIDLSSGKGTPPHPGVLTLQEGGAGALPEKQMIPVLLPAASSTATGQHEAASSGVNTEGLMTLATNSGGTYDALPDNEARRPDTEVPPRPLHVPLLAIAGGLFAVAMLGKELKL